MKAIRLVALLLAAMIVFSAFVACGDTTERETAAKNNNESTTEATTSEQEIEVLLDTPRNNYDETFYLQIMNDSNNIDYHWVEESENDVLSEAIFTRQENVREYLGVEAHLSRAGETELADDIRMFFSDFAAGKNNEKEFLEYIRSKKQHIEESVFKYLREHINEF